jgi:5-methylcytosine-specific restriction endonuclease McrBC regulatory subunit McrC
MQITEYGEPVVLDICKKEADDISKTGKIWQKKLKLTKQPFKVKELSCGKFELSAKGIAGFIRVGKLTLEIAPKFLNQETSGSNWRKAMWKFLAYGHGVQALGHTSGNFSKDEGIADILADIFLKSLNGASTRGYPLGYVTRKLDSSFLSGRLDPKKYSRLIPVTGKIGIIANKLSKDIATNRLIKWAGLELARTVESPDRRKKLKAWANELPGVSVLPPEPDQVPSLNQQYPHIADAVEISKLLLEDRKSSYGQGDLSLPGFLWDSDNLFERATRRLIAESAKSLGLSTYKNTHRMAKTCINGKDKFTNTTPDIDVCLNENSVFIVDSKYKNLGKHPSNEDFYQVLAAGRVRSVETVALIYPASGKGLNYKVYDPLGDGYPSKVVTATIGLESFTTRKDIRLLKSDITNWIKLNTPTLEQ